MTVLTFYGNGPLLPDLEAAGVSCWAARKRGRWDFFRFCVRMIGELRRLRPAIIYSSMPAANILAACLRIAVGRPVVVWRLAASTMELSRYDWFTSLSYRIEAALSGVPAAIVANSDAARDSAIVRGMDPARLFVVDNGIDTDAFSTESGSAGGLRKRWGLESYKWVIGQVARIDPKKDYATFIEAAALMCDRRGDVGFVCVGATPGAAFARLRELADERGLGCRIAWEPMQSNMPAVYSAMDINTLSSAFGEGFPNAVGEAMACGTPCVVTDVGDSARIVGDAGEVIPPGSPAPLADAWERLIERLEREGRGPGRAARDRVVRNFGLAACIDATEALLRSVR